MGSSGNRWAATPAVAGRARRHSDRDDRPSRRRRTRRPAPTTQPAFLTEALGSADASAPLVRHPAKDVRVELEQTGVAVARGSRTVKLTPDLESTETWQRFDGGVSRSTPLGQETITVDGKHAEHFLTVDRHVGAREWRWKLDTKLRARIGDDGAIAFLDGPAVTSLHIPPPAIFDADGDDVTPKDARWGLDRRGADTFLTLALDDSELSLPYVIDPAITYDTTTEAASVAAGSNTVTVNRPAGVRQNDVVVVTLSHRHGTNGSVTTVPAAWTLLTFDDNNTTNELDTYWHRVGPIGSEPANYSWVLSATTQWVVGAAAFSGLDSLAPVDVQAGVYNNTTTNVVPSASIAGVDAGSVVIGQYSRRRRSRRHRQLDERRRAGTRSSITSRRTRPPPTARRPSMYYRIQPAAGASPAHTATCVRLHGRPQHRRPVGAQVRRDRSRQRLADRRSHDCMGHALDDGRRDRVGVVARHHLPALTRRPRTPGRRSAPPSPLLRT